MDFSLSQYVENTKGIFISPDRMILLVLPHNYVHSLTLCHSLAHSNTDQLIILQDVTQFHYIEATILIESAKMEVAVPLSSPVVYIFIL